MATRKATGDGSFRILSIDGGGIRGLIPSMVLAEIERRTGKTVCDLFDLLAGTSTGGIIALALVKPHPDGSGRPHYSARDLVELYETQGHRIFSASVLHKVTSLGNILDKKYASEPVEGVLEEYFGDAMLSEALKPVLIPSYEIELRTAFFFKSVNARGTVRLREGTTREDYDFPMREVARATSAAPTYFAPEWIKNSYYGVDVESATVAAARAAAARTEDGGGQEEEDDEENWKDEWKAREKGYYALIDGGTYANNPTMCAVAEAICATKFDRTLGDLFVLSLGTGEQKRPLYYHAVKIWGVLSWAQPILSVVFHGISDTVDYQARLILNGTGAEEERKRHYRLQIRLDDDNAISLDDTSEAAIETLKRLARKLIRRHDAEIDTICRRLEQGGGPNGGGGGGGAKKRAAKKGRAAAKKGGAAAAGAKGAASPRKASKKASKGAAKARA